MKIGIIMGSDSDFPIMKQAVRVLHDFGVKYEVIVASAHRTPEDVFQFVKKIESEEGVCFIAGAGAAAHLPGVIAGHTTLPVIGVPISSSALDGMDALLSIVQMPPGMPVDTMAIDGAKNAALFALQCVGAFHKDVGEKYRAFREKMAEDVRRKNEKIQIEIANL